MKTKARPSARPRFRFGGHYFCDICENPVMHGARCCGHDARWVDDTPAFSRRQLAADARAANETAPIRQVPERKPAEWFAEMRRLVEAAPDLLPKNS